ncbi:MAG: hypothetical protein HQ402_00370 [Parcubacteria group bacterium]|nr:hypothetical protein [Parcubacteria group bacterium]
MYIRTVDALESVLVERRSIKEKIRERLDEWAHKAYGLQDFSRIVEKHTPFCKNGVVCSILARQIASICTEDIAVYIGSNLLGLKPITLQFVRDKFVFENHDKRARIKVPWTYWSKKGNFVVNVDNVAAESSDKLSGRVLSCIQTKYGKDLISYHNGLRASVFGPDYLCPDLSLFHAECLAKSTKRPSFVYKNVDGYDVRDSLMDGVDNADDTYRPPASWYYPLYLAMFLLGDMVLLETYENPDSGVPEAKKLFERTMKIIQSMMGAYPIVIEVPPLTPDMLYCNKVFIDDPEALTRLLSMNHQIEHSSLCNTFRTIAEKVIQFR